ncbi:MAG: low molecular weight phosphotyrosine protein phosphatase [bacterium]|nr:low molecular weight phosphotyrosine protein phosphatase [bacterium]
MSKEQKKSVLFVCLGNICRSPLAEAVFRHQIKERGVEHLFRVESRGTGGWHVGGPAHPVTCQTAEGFGIDMSTHQARQVSQQDLREFELVVAMDADNYSNLVRMGAVEGEQLVYLRAWDEQAGADISVPDPYFGGADGFVVVHKMIERSCSNLLDALLG